jgi:ubiquitin-protein ligase
VLTDQQELNSEMPKQIVIRWPDANDIMNFEVTIRPDENVWKGAQFSFTVQVGENYPIDPPKVLSKKVPTPPLQS